MWKHCWTKLLDYAKHCCLSLKILINTKCMFWAKDNILLIWIWPNDSTETLMKVAILSKVTFMSAWYGLVPKVLAIIYSRISSVSECSTRIIWNYQQTYVNSPELYFWKIWQCKRFDKYNVWKPYHPMAPQAFESFLLSEGEENTWAEAGNVAGDAKRISTCYTNDMWREWLCFNIVLCRFRNSSIQSKIQRDSANAAIMQLSR